MSNNPIEGAFIDVAYADLKPPSFIIEQVLPVGLTILSGPPKKAFKSLQTILMAGLCAQWPVKALPPWMKCNRTGPTLMMSYEADAGVIRYIIENDLKMKTEPGSIFVAHDPFKFQLDNPEQANSMLDYMDEKDPILVVMDPFRNMHAGDENDSGEVIRLLSPIVQWAHNHEASVLMVHHVNKPTEGKDGSSFYAMRGSSALPGLADGLLNVEMTKTDGEVILNATFKRGQSWRRTIHLGVEGYGWGREGYEVLSPVAQQVKAEWDKAFTAPEEIAATIKKPIGEVKVALEDLKRNNLLKSFGHWNRANIP